MTEFQRPQFDSRLRLDPQTVFTLLLIAVLISVGYLIGHYKGVDSVKSEIVEQGGQVQLSGTVKSVNKDGFTVETRDGNWKVTYGKDSNSGGPSGAGGPGGAGGEQKEVKQGDKVQVSGTPVGEHAIVMQTVTIELPPTPTPQPSASFTPRP